MVVNQNPGGKQEAPVISVSSSGLITATAGDETTTQQLPTQGSTTITPGTSQKTAVSSGRYTTGNVYVAGDSDLVASNIKSGVNIFGVTGTFEGESVETVTVHVSCSSRFVMDYMIYYLSNAQITSINVYGREFDENISVDKNTILACDFSELTSTDAEVLSGPGGSALGFFVTKDAEIHN